MARGKLLWETPPQPGRVGMVAFDPTGRLTAIAAPHSGVIRLHDVASGALVREFVHPWMYALAFSSDGRYLLTGGNWGRLWDVVSGKEVDWKLPHPGKIEAVSFSRDGRVLLTAGQDKTVRLWDSATGRPLGEPLLHSGWIKAAAFSLDDRTIVSATADGILYRWGRDTGAPLGQHLQPHGPGAATPRFSPDGRLVILVFGDGVAQLRDVATGKYIGPSLRHYGPIESIAFGPDGRSIVTVDTVRHTTRSWEIPTPAIGAIDRLVCWIEAITGLELDGDGTMQVLNAPSWRQRRVRLMEMGRAP